MANCRIKMHPSANEAVLREVVGNPDRSYYNNPNPRCEASHVYQMSMGKERPERIGTWELVCLALDSPRCKVQRGQQHSPATQQQLHNLVDGFESFLEKSKTLNGRLRKAQEALDELRAQNEIPALPKNAAEKISNQLETARGYLDGLRSDAVPATPRILARNAFKTPDVAGSNKRSNKTSGPAAASKVNKAAGLRKQDQTRSSRPKPRSHSISSIENESSGDDGGIQFRYPDCEPGTEYIADPDDKFIHAVIFYKANTNPLQIYLYAPRLSCFQFAKYKLPDECAGATFERFSTARNGYVVAKKDFNVTKTGRYIVYKRVGLPSRECAGIKDWETKANQSDADHRAEHAHLSPRASSPRERAHRAPQASSSRVLVEHLPDTSPPPVASLRQILDSEGVITRSRKRKLGETDFAESNAKGKGKARQT